MSISLSGSLVITGSIVASGGITGSFSGSATTSSYALTASSVLPLSQSLLVSGAITATGTLTAQTLVVQTVTSSIVYSSGSNIFGNSQSDVQQMTGSLKITGSLSLNNIAIPTSASLASTYLPLAGGTLTGALSGTSADFLTTTATRYLQIRDAGTSTPSLRSVNDTIAQLRAIAIEANTISLRTGASSGLTVTEALAISATGAATFASSVTINQSGYTFGAGLNLLNWQFVQGGDNALYLAYSGTQKFSMSSAGAAIFSSGIGIGGATATTGGIQFPATAVAIADANNLDDYEEGTWTPTYTGTNITITTYGSRSGYYTKVGRLVTLTFSIMTDAVSVIGSENVNIGGLPFASANVTENTNAVVIFDNSRWVSTPPVGGSISAGTSTIALNSNIGNTGAGQDPTRVVSSNMATGAGNRNMVRANVTYFTA